MKRIPPYIVLALILSLFVFSCSKKNNGGSPQNVQNITATPGYGSVSFSWTFPNDSAYLYVSISYVDSTGKVIEQKYSKYTDTAVISGLVGKAYDFTIEAVDLSGGVSASREMSVTPYNPVYDIVAPTLSIVPGIGSVKIKWQNPTGLTVGVQVAYLDSTGIQQTVSDSSSKGSDSLVIAGLQDVQTTFTVVLSDVAGAHGPDQVLIATPLMETRISKSGWSVTADSEETVGEPAPNGYATAAIDDNLNTYWHTEWDNAQPGYPHWLAIDMKTNVIVSRIELTPRLGKTDGFTAFDIDISNDGVNWTTYASNLSLVQNQTTQSFALASNPAVRYIRIYATQGVSFYANLAELTVYGSD